MHRKICNIISLIFSLFKFSLIKIFNFKNFSFHFIERFSPNVSIEIENGGEFRLGKAVRAHSNVKIKVRKGAKLIIHDNVSFNYGCMIFCRHNIEIDEGVEFGPGVLIYDHDHDFRITGGIKEKKFTVAPVRICKNAWIGANTIILKGSTIGMDSVIGAGSVVKSIIPPNNLFVQKKNNLFIQIKEQ